MENYGISVSDHNGIVRIKTFLTNADDIARTRIATVDDEQSSVLRLACRLIKGPVPVGLREDRYCVSFWEVL